MKQTNTMDGEKKSEFDVRVEMTVKVMPREYVSGINEKIMWDGIENDLNFEAKLLGKSLEKYFDYKARIIIEYKNYVQTNNSLVCPKHNGLKSKIQTIKGHR